MENWRQYLDEALDAEFDQMVAFRRHLHRNPELSGEENKTSLRIYQCFSELGLEVSLGPEGRGVVADLCPSSAGTGGMFAIRADIDALPIQDQKDVEYRSCRTGIMHACGHDAHTAILFGALTSITRIHRAGRLPFHPRLRTIFQPAEEICEGARVMIGAGALDGVETIIAAHVDPTRGVGRIGLREGVLTANCDDMRIFVRGRGGHAARPHEARDPITAAAQLINLMYLQIPRSTNSLESVVLTVGQITGGKNANVIPDQVDLHGTLRTLNRDVRKQTIALIRRLATSVAMGSETTIDVEFGVAAPSVQNAPSLVQLLRETCHDRLGPSSVEIIPSPSMGSEDFALYSNEVPAAMFRLGSSSDPANATGLHSPLFDINEEALRIGARVMAHTAHELAGTAGRRHERQT